MLCLGELHAFKNLLNFSLKKIIALCCVVNCYFGLFEHATIYSVITFVVSYRYQDYVYDSVAFEDLKANLQI